jgi:hypothetical protein
MGPVPQGAIEALVSVSMVTIYFKFVYYGDLWFWVTNDHMSTRVWDTFVLWNNLIGTGPIRLVPKGQVTRGCGDNSLGLVSLGHFIWTPKFAHMRHHYLVWDTWNRLYGNRIEILHTQHPLYLKNASVWVTLHTGFRNGSAVWVVKKASSISDSRTGFLQNTGGTVHGGVHCWIRLVEVGNVTYLYRDSLHRMNLTISAE